MDLFNLISAPNPAKVKTETRPRAAHEVPLLTATANRVIDMEDMTGASGSSGTPSTVEKSLLDFSNEDAPPLITESIGRKSKGKMNCLKELHQWGIHRTRGKDYVASHPPQSTLGGKSLAFMGIGAGTTVSAPATQEIPVHTEGVSDPDPLLYAKPRSAPEQDVAQSFRKAVVTKDPDSKKSTSFTSMVGSPGSIYQPGWGVTNNYRLDTLAACQDMVDHIVPPGYFSKLRHLPNDEFRNQYNTTLTRQVAMGSQPRLRFEQETKLLKKALAQVARQDKRIEAREKHIRNVEALLEAEVDMEEAAEAQIMGEERIKAAFEEFKKYEDDRVMSEGLKHGVEHGKAKVDLAAIEAYDPEADTKYVAALHALKDLKYPLVDQLKKLKDVPIDVIMASLFLESDSGEDAPQWVCELCPSSSQLKILVYPEYLTCSMGVFSYVPNVLDTRKARTQNPWPPGLQPSYAASRL
nr:hypothetical protein [Tanacetum cinerariifolium]